MNITINTSELLKVLEETPSNQNIMLVGKHGIGKSQILTVPIAEAAKYLAPGIDIDDLVGTWSWKSYYGEVYSFTFRRDFSGTLNAKDGEEQFTYEIEGKNLMIYYSDRMSRLRYHKGKIYNDTEQVYTR